MSDQVIPVVMVEGGKASVLFATPKEQKPEAVVFNSGDEQPTRVIFTFSFWDETTEKHLFPVHVALVRKSGTIDLEKHSLRLLRDIRKQYAFELGEKTVQCLRRIIVADDPLFDGFFKR